MNEKTPGQRVYEAAPTSHQAWDYLSVHTRNAWHEAAQALGLSDTLYVEPAPPTEKSDGQKAYEAHFADDPIACWRTLPVKLRNTWHLTAAGVTGKQPQLEHAPANPFRGGPWEET